MGLEYQNLDQTTREKMIEELDLDIANRDVFISGRLNPEGQRRWPELIREASLRHDDNWLATQIRDLGLLNAEEVAVRNGVPHRRRMAVNAPDLLAEGEFNRLYIRGICCRAINSANPRVVVYRGRESSHPRPGSEELIGTNLDANALRADLRASKGVQPQVLPDVNSGLTVRLP